MGGGGGVVHGGAVPAAAVAVVCDFRSESVVQDRWLDDLLALGDLCAVQFVCHEPAQCLVLRVDVQGTAPAGVGRGVEPVGAFGAVARCQDVHHVTRAICLF